LPTPPIENQKINSGEGIDGVDRDRQEKVEPKEAVREWQPARVGFEVVKILAIA
jgi:hypothetical protein